MIAEHRKKNVLMDPVDSTVLQLPRALVASILAALVDFLVLAFFREVGGWNPLGAAAAGYLVGGVLQYVLCSVWVFGNANAPGSKAIGFATFTLLSLVGLGITEVVMGLGALVQVTYSAKIAALGATFAWNFFSRKYLLFRPAKPAPTPRSGRETMTDIHLDSLFDPTDLQSPDKHEALARWVAQMVKGAPVRASKKHYRLKV